MAAVSSARFPKRRELPKLMACMTKTSLENMRNKALYTLDLLDSKAIRRRKLALHECLILELKESGYLESADYLQDLLYDNMQLVAEDEIGIVVDLTKTPEYLEHIAAELQKAEKQKDKGNTKQEALHLLGLALKYAEKGKGLLWLAEKFFMASIAVASQYLVDGGRQKGCCKYHYAKFLLDKFPGADQDEPFQILTEVRDSAIGKVILSSIRKGIEKLTLSFSLDCFTYFAESLRNRRFLPWPLYEPDPEEDPTDVPDVLLFKVAAIQMHRVLISQARSIRKQDPGKAERLARLAERRAIDAGETGKEAEAIIEIGICQLAMNNLNNAQKTLERAFMIHSKNNNIEGLCDTRMHMAAVLQRLGNHEEAARLLTEMGALAMEHGLRLHLGRALHLIGELHLRREMPELGTQHLQEALGCFMGFNWQLGAEKSQKIIKDSEQLDVIFQDKKEIFVEEAEQSRLMMAISSGQEKMASYFNELKEAKYCTISKMKVIEWKLSNAPWWVTRTQHDYLPCPCPQHHRTPLDVLRFKMEIEKKIKEMESREANLNRIEAAKDLQQLKSSNDLETENVV